MVLFWGGGWYILEVLKQSKELDLGARLEAAAKTASAMNLGQKTFILLEQTATKEAFEEDLFNEYDSLKQALKELKEQNGLRSAMIINAKGQVLADSNDEFSLGEQYPLLALDEEEIEKSFNGRPAISPLYHVEKSPHKRCYAPLYNSQSEVTAALRLEASRDYFEGLTRIKSHLLGLGVVLICLVSLVALLFYKLLQSLLKTEETLAQTDRLQSLGAMAAGLAHEIRNPLSIIRATAENISEELSPSSNQQQFLKSIIDESDRLNQLMTRFLQFSKPFSATDKLHSCDAKQVILSVADMVKKDYEKKSVSIKIDMEEELPRPGIDEKSLRQILLNLILNAGEAIENQGRIEIIAKTKKNRLNILVSDTGKGLSGVQTSRMFDPFFTTKKKGTGLGLFVSRMLAERSGGKISISQKDRGVVVTIDLPVS